MASKYVMTEATRQRCIDLQVFAEYWYNRSRQLADGIESAFFDIEREEMAICAQQTAAQYAAKYRAILCD